MDMKEDPQERMMGHMKQTGLVRVVDYQYFDTTELVKGRRDLQGFSMNCVLASVFTAATDITANKQNVITVAVMYRR